MLLIAVRADGKCCVKPVEIQKRGKVKTQHWRLFASFVLFYWALIMLSSLSGASLIVHSATFQRHTAQLLFVVLVVAGIVVQAGMNRRSRAPAGG